MFENKQLKNCSKIINTGETSIKKFKRSFCIICTKIAKQLSAEEETLKCRHIDMDQENNVRDCF